MSLCEHLVYDAHISSLKVIFSRLASRLQYSEKIDENQKRQNVTFGVANNLKARYQLYGAPNDLFDVKILVAFLFWAVLKTDGWAAGGMEKSIKATTRRQTLTVWLKFSSLRLLMNIPTIPPSNNDLNISTKPMSGIEAQTFTSINLKLLI